LPAWRHVCRKDLQTGPEPKSAKNQQISFAAETAPSYQSQGMTCRLKSMDFFVWQGRSGTGLQAGVRAASAGGVNSWLFTTSATRPGGKRRDVMARYG
jgi:hypothetical protein